MGSSRASRETDQVPPRGRVIRTLAAIGVMTCAHMMSPVRAQAHIIPDPDAPGVAVRAPARPSLARLADALASASVHAPQMTSSWNYDPTVNLPVSTAEGDQTFVQGSTDGAGGAIFAYSEGFAQHVLASGTVDPAWPVNGTPIGFGGLMSMTFDGAGGVYIVMGQGRPLAQHLLSTGVVAPGWPAGGIALSTGVAQLFPRVVSDGAGGAIATWGENRGGSNAQDIYAMHLLSGGVDPAWPVNGLAVCSVIRNQRIPVMCSDGAGGAIIAWRDSRVSATSNDIFAQHVLGSGIVDPAWPVNGVGVCTDPARQGLDEFTPAGTAIIVMTCSPDNTSSEIIPDGAGGCIVTWGDYRTAGTTSLDVYAHHVLASGVVDPAWTPQGVPLSTAVGEQALPLLSSDGAGGAIATWNTVDPHALFVQHLRGDGTVAGPANGLQFSTAGGGLSTGDSGDTPWSVSDGAGGAFVTWSDTRDVATRGRDLYIQHIQTSPSFGVDPAWTATGVPVSIAPGDQVISVLLPAIVANGLGDPVLAWDDSRDVATTGIDIYSQGISRTQGFIITASAGSGGTITPSGAVNVTAGADQSFAISANACYLIADVIVDGVSRGAVSSYTFTNVTANHTISATFVANPAPVASITGPPSGSIYPANTAVAFSGAFTDNAGDTHVAKWYYDGILASDAVTITGEGTASATIATSHTFTAAGVYNVGLTVTDQCGGIGGSTTVGGLDAMVVIFDPSAGFLTGGGWINSPIGAYKATPALVGKANFGFVSKYLNGSSIPTGETEFQFKPGNLNFHSTSYDWLVIDGYLAQYKGSGTVNNAGNYGLLLTAIDGDQPGGGGQDRFRIKIWNKTGGAVIYDNMLGGADDLDPTTALGGGQIQIHTGGSAMTTPPSDPGIKTPSPTPTAIALPETFELAQNQPNPFDEGTNIRFALPQRANVELAVFDLGGRRVKTLVSGSNEPGRYAVRWSGRGEDGAPSAAGLYFVRMTATSEKTGERFSALRKITLTR